MCGRVSLLIPLEPLRLLSSPLIHTYKDSRKDSFMLHATRVNPFMSRAAVKQNFFSGLSPGTGNPYSLIIVFGRKIKFEF
jgi:hypothetical protein